MALLTWKDKKPKIVISTLQNQINIPIFANKIKT
jgi:hypothetical protein